MKEKIVLKSLNPKEYGDLEIGCKVIPNEKIGEYVSTIEEEKKFSAYKTAAVSARAGVVGEKIKTTLYVERDGKMYILSEVENEVKLRKCKDGVERPDVVVTNVNSTSNEQYIVKYDKFIETYATIGNRTIPQADVRKFAQVDEDIAIMTSWGEPAYCLSGSYIVMYNAQENDYNTVERGAFDSTYSKEDCNVKKI